MNGPEKTTAPEFRRHVPGKLDALGSGPAWTDVLVDVYTRNRKEESILVPAVAEPLIVWIVSGSAVVEEREFDGPWSARSVSPGDFFLTTSPTPYELRWRVTSSEPFQVCQVYISLPTFARAFKEIFGTDTQVPSLRDVSGERDAIVSALVDLLRVELASQPASPLYVRGIAQSLAVHLIRTYPDASGSERSRRGELPAFKLRRIINLLEANLDEEFQLARLAEEAGVSQFHL